MIEPVTSLSPPEARALTRLCHASKAAHGYDAAFMAACDAALLVSPSDALRDHMAVVRAPASSAAPFGPPGFLGMVQVSVSVPLAELEKLFVCPSSFRLGLGAALLSWAASSARARGARLLGIDADPGAVAFYQAQGARVVGSSPSEAIPGRLLPRLELPL